MTHTVPSTDHGSVAGPLILVVTGVSGVGKTAAVEALERRANPRVRCFYFDRIGVPALDVMTRDYGGPEGWQADATRRWIERLARERTADAVLVLDGQTRPTFVRAALVGHENVRARIVLVECDRDVRAARLATRGHPELATPTMDNWAAYLRGQADALQLAVIDTTQLTIEAAADAIEGHAQALLTSPG